MKRHWTFASITHLQNVLQALCADWHEVLLVVRLAVEVAVLAVDGGVPEVALAREADEAALLAVQGVLGLHGLAGDLLLALAALVLVLAAHLGPGEQGMVGGHQSCDHE